MSAEYPNIILASSSPRRAALLRALGFTFQVRPVSIDESRRHGEPPRRYAVRLAEAKATAGAFGAENSVVIGCDTIVVHNYLDFGRPKSKILGKPRDEEEAAEMLRLLSGREHTVISAVALKWKRLVFSAGETAVVFAPLSEEIIRWYVRTGEPMDKAGAYGIQGRASLFITGVIGSCSNVVGLPVDLLPELFAKLGLDIYEVIESNSVQLPASSHPDFKR